MRHEVLDKEVIYSLNEAQSVITQWVHKYNHIRPHQSLDTAVKHGVSVVLTSDHGNCDEMVDPHTGEPHTQHTTYPVPCLVVDGEKWTLSNGGGLSDVAPTILQLMGIRQPKAMTGTSLLMPYNGY